MVALVKKQCVAQVAEKLTGAIKFLGDQYSVENPKYFGASGGCDFEIHDSNLSPTLLPEPLTFGVEDQRVDGGLLPGSRPVEDVKDCWSAATALSGHLVCKRGKTGIRLFWDNFMTDGDTKPPTVTTMDDLTSLMMLDFLGE